jgi:hypothetical protein
MRGGSAAGNDVILRFIKKSSFEFFCEGDGSR